MRYGNVSILQADVKKNTFAIVNTSRINVYSGITLHDNTVLTSPSGLCSSCGGSGMLLNNLWILVIM
jgi:hypothetical protein